MRLVFLAVAAAALMLTTTACNTVEGMGEDVQIGGEKLQRAADENKGEDSERHGY